MDLLEYNSVTVLVCNEFLQTEAESKFDVKPSFYHKSQRWYFYLMEICQGPTSNKQLLGAEIPSSSRNQEKAALIFQDISGRYQVSFPTL